MAQQLEVMHLRHVRSEREQLLDLHVEGEAARRQLAQPLLDVADQIVHVLLQLRRGQHVCPRRRGGIGREWHAFTSGLDPLAKVCDQGAELLELRITEGEVDATHVQAEERRALDCERPFGLV